MLNFLVRFYGCKFEPGFGLELKLSCGFRVLTIALGLVLLVPRSLLAQAPISITADQVDYDETIGLLRAQGNYVIRHGDAELIAPQGSYNHNTGQSILRGGVVLNVAQQRFEAQSLTGNHYHGIFLLEGNVTYAPVPEVTIHASDLIYSLATRTADFRGTVEVQHTQWQATAEQAEVTATAIVLLGNGQLQVLPETEHSPQSFERLKIDLPRLTFASIQPIASVYSSIFQTLPTP